MSGSGRCAPGASPGVHPEAGPRGQGGGAPATGATAALLEPLLSGSRRALARAITLVESTRPEHREEALRLLECLPAMPDTRRVGISGAPGVGKSTFIEALGLHVLRERGEEGRVAVLTVDPSSRVSGGSILGDKTRMGELARSPRAFIRPSPAGETLGGVARRTREVILLCEAAGFDTVLVETVGVGQSETAVADMTDVLVLLLLPMGGDELQGIKRGVMELADIILVNKADGEMREAAERTVAEYRGAVPLLRPASPGWTPVVQACSAATGAGIPEAWAAIEAHQERMRASSAWRARRARQARGWLWEEVLGGIRDRLRQRPEVEALVGELERSVVEGRISPPGAARQVLERLFALPPGQGGEPS